MIGKFQIRTQIFIEPKGVRFRAKWRDDNQTFSVAVNLPVKIEPSKWNKDTMRCKNNTFHFGVSAQEINKSLNSYESIAHEIFNSFVLANQIPTAEQFRQKFRTSLGKDCREEKDNGTIYKTMSDFFAKEEPHWADGTYKKFKTLRRFLQTWKPNLTFSEIDKELFNDFINEKIKRGYKNSTIRKELTFFKWFLRWAKNNGYSDTTIQDTYRYKFKGTDGNFNTIVYLSWEELLALYNFDFSQNKAIEQVRDVFCFCCFTSLRYSDVKKLQCYDVKNGVIEIVTQKTSEPIKIELNKYSRAILEKYKNVQLENNAALPVVSNAKMNKHLKEMAKLAGLDEYVKKVYFVGNVRHEEIYRKHELITTHCGRRTFIVNALYLGIPAEVVMKWTGHSDYESMKPYIAISDKLKEMQMDKFNRD